ncbi:MAG TPA: hypothetical protein VFC78_17445 [Tepidisphaeraceae bacterium]|nr:hypothetical protein [Tepidisphaeraceae bacterium]
MPLANAGSLRVVHKNLLFEREPFRGQNTVSLRADNSTLAQSLFE